MAKTTLALTVSWQNCREERDDNEAWISDWKSDLQWPMVVLLTPSTPSKAVFKTPKLPPINTASPRNSDGVIATDEETCEKGKNQKHDRY